MVAARQARRVVCTIVRVAESPVATRCRPSAAGRLRPSQLLPWADPYIAGLVTQLQDEVRRERRREALAAARERRQTIGGGRGPVADLDPPNPFTEGEGRREDDLPYPGE